MNSAAAPESGTPKTPAEAPVEAASGARSVHKLAAVFEEAAAGWRQPERVASLKEFVDSEHSIKHQRLLSDALQEHLDNSHALDMGTILTIAYLANDGLLLREKDDEASTSAQRSPQNYSTDWDDVAQWGEQMGALSLDNAEEPAKRNPQSPVALNAGAKSDDDTLLVEAAKKVTAELIKTM